MLSAKTFKNLMKHMHLYEVSGLLFQRNGINRKLNHHNSCLLLQKNNEQALPWKKNLRQLWIFNLMLRCLRYVLFHFVVLPLYERGHCNKNGEHKEAILSCCFHFVWFFNTFVGDQMSGVIQSAFLPGTLVKHLPFPVAVCCLHTS